MDRFSEKQAQIDRYRVEACTLYPARWSNMIADWNMPDPVDRVWLTYSANYLFRTANLRWAIDPLTLNWRIKNAPKVEVARDLHSLSLVFLTHEHKDHLDLDLLAALRNLPITWVVPDFILSKIMIETGLPRAQIIVPSHLNPIELRGIRILPFDGLHWETTPDGSLKGVPAMGYRIECNGKRWLFLGDTRTYDSSLLPALGSIDSIFAHLWLGRGCALMDEPPLLDVFCRFLLDLSPCRLILTHLHELGRDANDYWDESHVQTVCSKLREMTGSFPVTHITMGESTVL